MLAIELNDIGIRAAQSGDDGLLALDEGQHASPGCACIDGSSLVTGVAAARQACLRPLAAHNRFWDRLDTERITANDKRSPNHAEVACAHLKQLLSETQGDEVVMAVPSTYDRNQLGVLAGIARELRLPLRGIVVSPIAVDPVPAPDGSFLLVEMTLHRCVLSVVDNGPRVHVRQTKHCPAFGLEAFRRKWLDAIGAEFLRKTRFDPHHDAKTEQELHDSLPDTLAALQQGDSHSLELDTGSQTHRITVTEQLVARSGHSLIFDLCADVQAMLSDTSAIVLSSGAATVPGLRQAIEQQNSLPAVDLEPGAPALGLLNLWPDCFEQPSKEGVAYHTWRERRPTAVKS